MVAEKCGDNVDDMGLFCGFFAFVQSVNDKSHLFPTGSIDKSRLNEMEKGPKEELMGLRLQRCFEDEGVAFDDGAQNCHHRRKFRRQLVRKGWYEGSRVVSRRVGASEEEGAEDHRMVNGPLYDGLHDGRFAGSSTSSEPYQSRIVVIPLESQQPTLEVVQV